MFTSNSGVVYTNKHSLPLEICNAICRDRYSDTDEAPFHYSASSLVAPTQQVILKKRHKDNLIVRDVLDQYWMFRGSVSHQVLEDAHHESFGSFVEERLYIDVLDRTISGKFDCYHDGEIRDYKFTKAYKIMKGDFSDWEAQLNIYSYLLKANGHSVSSLTVYAFIDDWSKKDSTYRKGYPPINIHKISLNLWTTERCRGYIEERVRLLIENESLGGDKMTPCSDRDMWRETLDWACLKEGATKATRKFDTKEEAEEYAKGKDLKVVERKSSRRRCLSFCDCSNICFQNAALLKEEGVSEESDEETIF